MNNVIFSFVLVATLSALTGCASQPLPKNPPIVPYTQKQWVAVNADDFVPPKAKTYVKVQEIGPDTLQPQHSEQE